MTILFFGPETDPHLNMVANKARTLGEESVFIDFSRDISPVSYYFNSNGSKVAIVGLSNEEITSMYWRPAINNDSCDQQYTVKELCKYQEYWNHFLPFDSLNGIKSINPVFSTIKMENKIHQLEIAVRCGFNIPDTIISSHKNLINEFLTMNNNCIYKSLGMNWDENNKPMATKSINPSDLRVEQIFPMIYQEKILRKSELRIYVIGDAIIPIEIVVSNEDQHIPDWRQGMPSYKICSLDYEIISKIKAYQEVSNLIYAAFDFIVNEENELIFLECNPSGNWAFLSEDIREKIIGSIAHELLIPNQTRTVNN